MTWVSNPGTGADLMPIVAMTDLQHQIPGARCRQYQFGLIDAGPRLLQGQREIQPHVGRTQEAAADLRALQGGAVVSAEPHKGRIVVRVELPPEVR